MSTTFLSTSGNGTNVNVTFFITTGTPNSPAQQVTIGQYPASNPGFSRAVQLSNEYVYIKRGSGAVAIPVADLCGIAAAQVPALSYSPLFTLQPANTSVVSQPNGTNHAYMNVAANSESNLTYVWKSWNGTAWSANITTGGIYNVANSQSLNISPTDNSPNGWQFVCTAFNASGNTNSTTVTLTVT